MGQVLFIHVVDNILLTVSLLCQLENFVDSVKSNLKQVYSTLLNQ